MRLPSCPWLLTNNSTPWDINERAVWRLASNKALAFVQPYPHFDSPDCQRLTVRSSRNLPNRVRQGVRYDLLTVQGDGLGA